MVVIVYQTVVLAFSALPLFFKRFRFCIRVAVVIIAYHSVTMYGSQYSSLNCKRRRKLKTEEIPYARHA